VTCIDGFQGKRFNLPQQALKTIHTYPLTFVFSVPLALYGARLSLKFAESFWEEIQPNSFSGQEWAAKDTGDLDAFASRVVEYLEGHRASKMPHPMLSSDLDESAWLVHYSPRHKRRLYRTAFGLSRRELQNIRNVQSFLEQTCDFASRNPRIIQHVNPEVFYDQPHLNRTFRKLTGFTPLEYFQASSILQDNLMSASYNEISGP
jgi:AraC-like DNA-binding protein